MFYADKYQAINLDYITNIDVAKMTSEDYRIRLYFVNDSYIDIARDIDEATAEKYFENLLEDIDNAKSQHDGVIYGLRLEDREEEEYL